MSTALPPEDQPPFMLMVPADTAEAEAAMGPSTQDNPIAVACAIKAGAADPVANLRVLQAMVTPESRPAWGDFRWVHELLADCGVTTAPTKALADRDVVYVKFLTDHDGVTQQATQDGGIMVRAVMTMVHRPQLGGWFAHGLGDYLAPELVPHDD